jgi:hypothetical protein
LGAGEWGVRLKENSAKPEWFPLPVHLKRPATLEHWARCIALRLAIANSTNSIEWKAAHYRSAVIADKRTDWPTDARKKLMGVKCVTAFEAFTLADAFNVPANAPIRALADKHSQGDYDLSQEAQDLKYSLGELDCDRFQAGLEYRLPVMVNLALDDATLKEHFDAWLNMMREQIIRAAGPIRIHRIDDDFLDRCHAMRVIAAFDLINWRALSGATYSDAAIASWLWPDSGPLSDGTFVDRAERLRKVTKPLMEAVMQWPTIERIEQRQAEKQFMEAEQSRLKNVPEPETANSVPEQDKAA